MRMTVGDCQVVSASKTSPTGGDVGTLGVGDVLPALASVDPRNILRRQWRLGGRHAATASTAAGARAS